MQALAQTKRLQPIGCLPIVERLLHWLRPGDDSYQIGVDITVDTIPRCRGRFIHTALNPPLLLFYNLVTSQALALPLRLNLFIVIGSGNWSLFSRSKASNGSDRDIGLNFASRLSGIRTDRQVPRKEEERFSDGDFLRIKQTQGTGARPKYLALFQIFSFFARYFPALRPQTPRRSRHRPRARRASSMRLGRASSSWKTVATMLRFTL